MIKYEKKTTSYIPPQSESVNWIYRAKFLSEVVQILFPLRGGISTQPNISF